MYYERSDNMHGNTRRLPANERWDATPLRETDGTTWQPVPWHKRDDALIDINVDGTTGHREDEDADSASYGMTPVEEDGTPAARAHSSPTTDIRVTHGDTEKHGAAPCCPSCQHITNTTTIPRGV